MPITASVGSGGKNLKADTLYVQGLISYWQASEGRVPIKVDGIVGPKTIAAIMDFQKAKTGWVDGRVDPAGKTLRTLEAQAEPLFREMKAFAVLAAALSYDPRQLPDNADINTPPRFETGFVGRLFKEALQ